MQSSAPAPIAETGWSGKTQWILDQYRCVYDSDTESFLRSKAIEMELRDLSRTYVAFSKKNKHIYGYVTLAIKST